jgi:hypothetical protein
MPLWSCHVGHVADVRGAGFRGVGGADAVVGMCVARNLPMRCIFAGAGMTMTREDDEVHACRQLAADRAATGNRHALAA